VNGRERGIVTLWVLGLCVGLMFLGGLSLDLWRAAATRRGLSAMADAAATAGANGVDEHALRAGVVRIDAVRARTIAEETLRAYGQPVAALRIDTTDDSVTVTIRDRVRFTLLGIFMGGGHFDVEAHATASPVERR
jgi:hypothetical protein